jgi:transposase
MIPAVRHDHAVRTARWIHPRRARAARTAEDAGGRAVRARGEHRSGRRGVPRHCADGARVAQAVERGWGEALRSRGPVSVERLSARQWACLEQELRRGPGAHGFTDDQRWTLKRVRTLIGRLFHVGCTVQGVWKLLRRHGWSCQVPVRQAVERDEEAIDVWKEQVWPQVNHGS